MKRTHDAHSIALNGAAAAQLAGHTAQHRRVSLPAHSPAVIRTAMEPQDSDTDSSSSSQTKRPRRSTGAPSRLAGHILGALPIPYAMCNSRLQEAYFPYSVA